MFMSMIDSIKDETIEFLFKVQAVSEQGLPRGVFQSVPQHFVHDEATPMSRIPTPSSSAVPGEMEQELPQREPPSPEQFKREAPKVGRNDPCPCGSDKKYKKCCGK